VAIIGLVARFLRPRPASPRTRDRPPPGYGVREQCLPFTAAAALGLAVPSPFAWGYCLPAEAPAGARTVRSPVAGGCLDRLFYVVDDPTLGFERNAFAVPAEIAARIGAAPMPGLSFFDRPDQQDHVKLHLPYVWRTPQGLGLFFTAPVNRPRGDRLELLAGFVESDWYPNPVNLVLALPPAPGAAHVAAGEIIAQAIPIPDALRQPRLEALEGHRREARDVLDDLRSWRDVHRRDRSAYKRLTRSRHGVLTGPGS
jgi:hypothetical protein